MDTVCYTLCVATPYILCPSVYFEVSPLLQKILDLPLKPPQKIFRSATVFMFIKTKATLF